MHDRISINQICFQSESLAAFLGHLHELGARRASFLSTALLADGAIGQIRADRAGGDYRIETIAHVFMAGGPISTGGADWQAPRETLTRLIDIAGEIGARSIYLLTGGHGALEWEEAAASFCEALSPCVEQARTADVQLMVENASHIMADIHLAHSLADTIRLAEMAGVGVCIDVFGCWVEGGLRDLISRALRHSRVVQLSDYVYGDRSLPARAVPGDGAIPLRRLVGWMLEAGYEGPFDLELLGPRIDAEGRVAAVRRAADNVGAMLTALGA